MAELSGIQTLSLLNAQPEKPVLVLQLMELCCKAISIQSHRVSSVFSSGMLSCLLYTSIAARWRLSKAGLCIDKYLPVSKRLTDWLRCQYMAAKLSGFRPGRLGDCSDINKARPATRIGGDQMGIQEDSSLWRRLRCASRR